MMSYVLVVDDDDATCRMISLLLTTEGLTCRPATTGTAAVEHMAAEKPALVILDYLIPGVEPIELLARFGELGYDGKVLLCTALEGEPPVVTNGFLRKPFDPEDLATTVREMITPSTSKA